MKTDVLIIGAGPNGLAAALALGGATLRSPLNVIVIDARNPRTFAASGSDSRGTAITRTTQCMLAALGLWQDLAPHAEEMRDIIVTDGVGGFAQRPTLLSFATDDSHRAAASIIENRHIASALMAAVDRSPAITVLPETAIDGIKTDRGLAEVTTNNGEVIRASLVVAADGKASKTRALAGIKVQGHAYQQTALGFSISHQHPHNGQAQEHFSPDGVFAFLPLPENRASIVWGTSPDESVRLMALGEADFLLELNHKLGSQRGTLALASPRAAYPLALQIADQFIAPRTALIGDAAHAIHPLAGLGLNLGYKDVAALADSVAAAFLRGDDIGGMAVLETYQRSRRFDTWATAATMEAMNTLFSNNLPLLRDARKTGLKLIDQWPQAKSFLMREAAGEAQNLPRLMQGLLPG